MPKAEKVMCTECGEIASHPGHKEAHEHMRTQGHIAKSDLTGISGTQYRCVDCSTVWVLHTDKWGCQYGFKLVSTST